MNIFKLLLAFSLFSSLFVGQAFSGPANKINNDKLVNSYLIVEKLSRDGNANAISNKKLCTVF